MDSSSDATTRRTPRRRPDLNINTGPASAGRPRDIIVETPPGRKSKQRQQTTPSTTTSRALSRGPTATSLLSSRDVEGSSFLDNMTPVDVVSHRDHVRDIVDHDPSNGLLEAGNRDSHDLSLPARQVTRDSLVANMLLSLDQLSMDQLASAPTRGVGGGPYDTYGNEAATMSRVSVNMMTAGHGANGGAGHAYGYPSDTDGQEDVSRVHTSRGRTRSNSSAAYQPTIGRLNSLRSQQRADPPTSKHSRGAGKDSMGGSSTNGSIDGGYAHVIDSQRWPQTFGASRPAGLDQGGQHAGAPQTQWQADLSNSFLDDEYDAAPTPTVYSGPRRLPPSPIKPPTYPPPIPNQELHQPDMEPRSPGLERKRSTRSSRSARKESRLNRDHHVPPVPNIDLDSAPAPLVGYEKSKDPVLGGPPSTNATKERPGFFRRVFGGGSSRSNLNNVSTEPFPDASPYYTSTSGEMGDDRPNSHSRPPLTANNSRGAQSTPPSRDASHPPNVLQKKPSSFFRRRRKTSVSEPENPLPPPLPMPMVSSVTPQVRLPFDKDGASPVVSAPSPVSSLRRVMNPYLKGSPTTTATPSPLTSPEPTHQQGTLSKPLGGEASERELMGVSNSNGIHEAAYKPRGPIMDVSSNGIHEASYKSREPAMDAGNSNGIHESAYKSHEPIVDVGNSNGIGGAAYKSRDFESEYERRLPSSLVTPPHAVAPLQPDIAPIPIRRTDTPTRQPPEPPVERQLPEPPVERPPPKPDGGASFLADGTDDSDDGGEGDTTLRPHEPDAESYHLSPHSRGRSPAAKEPGGRDTLRPAAVSPGSRSVGGSSSRAESSNRSNLGLPIQDGNASASSRPATGSSADGVQKQPQRNKDKPLPSVREPSSTAAARRATCPGTVTTKNAEDSSSSGKPLDEPDFVVGEPSEDDRAKARAIYDGDESFVSREKAAAWMGEEGPVRQRTLRAYLELHDFRDTSIVDSLRLFCTRLMLRAETQQLDRILVAFSARWCECNPNHGFKSMGKYFYCLVFRGPASEARTVGLGAAGPGNMETLDNDKRRVHVS